MHADRPHLGLAAASIFAIAGTATAAPVLLPHASPSGTTPQRFTALEPEKTGLDFVNRVVPDHPRRDLFASAMAAGGLAVGDLDGNGLLDLAFANGPEPNALYLQTAPWRFERHALGTGNPWSVGIAIIDIDGDGRQDIYVCNYDSPNLLFLGGEASGETPVFREAAEAWGIAHLDSSHTPAFCDYDNDGDLDLYLLTNRLYLQGGTPPGNAQIVKMTPEGPRLIPEYEGELEITASSLDPETKKLTVHWNKRGRPDVLFRNDGERFTDVTVAAGMNAGNGHGLSATWWDFDQDGWQDLYVGNDFDSVDFFFRNKGDGTFENMAAHVLPITPWFSMGADFGDLDGNGWPDLLVADMMGSSHYKQKTGMGSMSTRIGEMLAGRPPQFMRNMLFLNHGVPRFMEAAHFAGLDGTDWTWSVNLADFDGDGRNDAFFTNGHSKNYNENDIPAALDIRPLETEWDRHIRAGTATLKEQNFAFHNGGKLHFEDRSEAWGLGHVGISYSAAHADLDNDGDLDLVVVNLDEPVSLYRNDLAATNRMTVSLKGTRSHPDGWGATIEIETPAGDQRRTLVPARGYLTSHPPIAHFGLGDAPSVAKVTVRWPSGTVQEFTDVAGGHHITITEPGDSVERSDVSYPPLAFRRVRLPAESRHVERSFDDFAKQPLLPNRLSLSGPAFATADVNADGHPDFFRGGAAGQAGALFFGTGKADSPFRLAPTSFATESDCEDVAATFFDADGDGDADLLVASGSSEFDPGDDALADRIYLNAGDGTFAPAAPDCLPDTRASTGAVAAHDFDGDGDIDLFLGGRFVQGRYPLAADNALLANDGNGRFTDVTPDGLRETGMVTDALWADADGDGKSDLILSHEWGPVRIFQSLGESLSELSAPAMAGAPGWWLSLAAADIDGDGDTDFLSTNWGKNTKYHASADHPALLYYGDFEGTGKFHLVEGEYEGETLFPIRGRSCSSRAMPFVAERFGSYREFAVAPLDAIYGDRSLESAERFEATTLAHTVWINDGVDGAGNLQLRKIALPWLAQLSCSAAAAFADFDADGKTDLFLGQNFYGPQDETGPVNGGYGLVLQGDGAGNFIPLSPRETGVIIPPAVSGAAAIDFDGDGLPDIVAACNRTSVQAFHNRQGN